MVNKLSSIFGIEILATQTYSKSGWDISQIIEPEWFVEKCAVDTDIHLEKGHKLFNVGKYPICIVASVFNVWLFFTK